MECGLKVVMIVIIMIRNESKDKDTNDSNDGNNNEDTNNYSQLTIIPNPTIIINFINIITTTL